MIGQILADRYLVLKRLGFGMITHTYLAQDLEGSDSARCAIKCLIQPPVDAHLSTVGCQLFEQEIACLQSLGNHGQIPKLLAHFTDQESQYLVQEFIDGHSLVEELPPGGWWPLAKVLQFLEDLLMLLAFVHNRGIIHRDIKPSNIMRCHRHHQLVLVDFGVAQMGRDRIGSSTSALRKDIVVGTPGYMAIEQAEGNPQLNSDLYSLGMIAIQALTGKSPRQLHKSGRGNLIWQEYARVDDEVAMILSKFVHPDYEQRFQSAGEARQAVQSLGTLTARGVDNSFSILNSAKCLRYCAQLADDSTSGTEPTEILVLKQSCERTTATSFSLWRWLLTVSIPALSKTVTIIAAVSLAETNSGERTYSFS